MVAPEDSPGRHVRLRTADIVADVVPRFRREGFAFVDPGRVLRCVGRTGEWQDFGSAWERLPIDGYLREGQKFRRRRYGRFQVFTDGSLHRRPHAPYYQSAEHNSYAGGIQRHYPTIESATLGDEIFNAVIRLDSAVISKALSYIGPWDVEVHLFRTTSNDGPASPTPEGVHRDGNDAFAVHLVDYRCQGGTTRIYATTGEVLAERTMTHPAETLYMDDGKVLHDVTHIHPGAAGSDAVRDIMIVDFHRAGTGS